MDDLHRERSEPSKELDALARAVIGAAIEVHRQSSTQMGGSAGTAVGTAAMRALLVGAPKVMVSTVAAGDTRAWTPPQNVPEDSRDSARVGDRKTSPLFLLTFVNGLCTGNRTPATVPRRRR